MAAIEWCTLSPRTKYLKEMASSEVVGSPADPYQANITADELTYAARIATAWAYRPLAPVFDVSNWTTQASRPLEVEDICLEYGSSLIWHFRDLRARSSPSEGVITLHESLAKEAKNRLVELLTSSFLLTSDGTVIQPKKGAGKTMPVVLGSFLGEPIFPSNTLENLRDARYNEIKWRW